MDHREWEYSPQPRKLLVALSVVVGLGQLYQGVLAIGRSDVLVGAFFVVAGLVVLGLGPNIHRFNRHHIRIGDEGIAIRRGMRPPTKLHWDAVKRLRFERLRIKAESARRSDLVVDFGQMSYEDVQRLRPEICAALREAAEERGIPAEAS